MTKLEPSGEAILKAGWVSGDVLEGRFSLKEAHLLAERKWTVGMGAHGVPKYESVRGYDPVLRAHCRLDEEG